MSVIELRDDQLEALAELLADKLAERAAGELIDAAELARRLGRRREWVYEHAASLSAIRIGAGARPRLLFRWPLDLEAVPKPRRPRATATRRLRRDRPRAAVELLPIRGEKT